MNISSICQFWLNFSAQTLAAIATLAAAIIALFGERIRAGLFRPVLSLRLLTSEGEKARTTLGSTNDAGQPVNRLEDARFYHVRVSNTRKWRWPAATGVQVHLIRIEERGPDDEFIGKFAGSLPIRWRLQEVKPLELTIGSSDDCDLCSVVKGKWIELHPLIALNHVETRWRQAMRVRVQLQAKSVETDSEPLTIEIAWDGKWADGDKEMTEHLRVKEIR